MGETILTLELVNGILQCLVRDASIFDNCKHRRTHEKVTSSACLFVGYCVGNIAGPFFYKSSQAPDYPLGIWSVIVSHLLEVVVVAFLCIILKRENQRRDDLQNRAGGAHGKHLACTWLRC